MPDMTKIRIPCYSMKMRLYPSSAQMDKLDKIFHALHVAYNITFHRVFLKDPMVCTSPKDNGDVWPDFKKIAGKAWRAELIKCNKAVEAAPAAALTTNNGLFLLDGKRAWSKGMHDRPVSESMRKDFRFYSKSSPRRSFMVQMPSKHLCPSPNNGKVAWVTIPKVEGRIKARSFDRKLWFGENGSLSYAQALEQNAVTSLLTVRVSKDTCGDYYISITFSEGKDRQLYREVPAVQTPVPVGVDVGIKDIAILSTGQKVENKHFKRNKKATLSRMSRNLSRRWGPANPSFRDFVRELRKDRWEQGENDRVPAVQPSKRYLKTQRNRAILERKIARQRDTYYHQQTSAIVRSSSLIAVETLHVKNMLRNHKLAYALSDAAMSDFLAKLKYKAQRRSIPILPIGIFESSSQRCSLCGAIDPKVKDLSIRRWVCPQCGAAHDRDVNAAKNILSIALEKGAAEDKAPPPSQKKGPPPGHTKHARNIIVDGLDIIVAYSKELSRPNDPRYVILNSKTDQIVDDAQGKGFKSASNAKNYYKAKKKRAG